MGTKRITKPSLNMIGAKFGKWIVEAELAESIYKSGDKSYLIRCSCGDTSVATGASLRKGGTKGCRVCADKDHGLSMKGIEKLGKGISALKAKLHSYKYMAKYRGYEWNLPDNIFFDLVTQDCYYCGNPPIEVIYKKYITPVRYNGVDRLDNSKGYSKGNCVTCCKVCNRMKMNHSYYFMIGHMKKIIEKDNERNG